MSRREQILDWLARLVTDRRRLVLGSLLAITALLATQIPKVEADPAPESLLSSLEDGSSVIRKQFEQWFGQTERVVLLLIEAPDVLTPQELQHLHDLSLHFTGKDWVDHVDSVTVLHIPRRVKDETAEQEDINLDDIEAVADDEAVDLDDIEADDEYNAESQDDFEDDVFNALLDIVESDPGRFSGGIAEVGPKLSAELNTSPIVEGTEVTAEEAADLAEAIKGTPLLEGKLISQDHTVAAVALHLKDLDHREMLRAVKEVRNDLKLPEFEGVSIHVGGLPYLRSVIVEKMREDNFRLIPLVVVVCMLLLFVSFQWLPGVFLPIAAVGMTALMVVGAMGLAGEPMNILNNIIVPLLIIIGISEAIHLIGRYWEEIIETGDPDLAAKRTVRAMAVACLLTAATTAVGLASLVVSKTVMLRHFGITAGIGIMVSYVITITFLPAILSWAKPPKATATHQWEGWIEEAIVKATAKILTMPWTVLGASTVFVVACVWGASSVVVDHALLDQFDPSDPVYITTRLLEDKLDGVRPLEVVMEGNDDTTFFEPEVLRSIEQVKQWAASRPEVIRAMGYDDILRETYALIADDPTVRDEDFRTEKQAAALATMVRRRDPNPLSSWMSPNEKHVRLQIKVRDIGAQATISFIEELEKEFENLLAPLGVRTSLTGEAYNGSRGQEAVVRDLLGSLAVAVVIIFLLLAILLRSVRLGLISIPPNLIPLIATMAYMVWRGIPLNISTVIIYSISLGLAVDGTIHVLARFREEVRRGLHSNAALIRAARGTGRAIVVSLVTLMAGFGVMLLSSFVPVRHFAELIAVTAGGCFIGTLVVLPALLKVAGMSRRERQQPRTSKPFPEMQE